MKMEIKGQDTKRYLQRQALQTICFNCDRRLADRRCCKVVGNGTPVHDKRYKAGQPFCPIGKHDGIEPRTINEQIATDAKSWKYYLTAAVKVACSIFGVCRTPDTIIRYRDEKCSGCQYNKRGILNSCRKCGCCLWSKIRIGTEACPVGNWKALAKPCLPVETLKLWGIKETKTGCNCNADKTTNNPAVAV